MSGRPSTLQLVLYAAIAAVLLLLVVRASSEAGTGGGGSAELKVSEGPRQPAGGSAGSAGDAVVHVAGAVAKPGVYRMPLGSRVADAIERAGGVTSEGEADAINLAARIVDGQQVVVPESAPGGAVASAGAGDGPISLGSATEADLEEIDGIGPVTAANIIEFRDQNGGISSIEDLDQISGIGPATIDSLSGSLQP
ncbi:MAG: SLBB domain-containing protein [Solirubrobacterales bacterium]